MPRRTGGALAAPISPAPASKALRAGIASGRSRVDGAAALAATDAANYRFDVVPASAEGAQRF